MVDVSNDDDDGAGAISRYVHARHHGLGIS
jgi:hypothetical protein